MEILGDNFSTQEINLDLAAEHAGGVLDKRKYWNLSNYDLAWVIISYASAPEASQFGAMDIEIMRQQLLRSQNSETGLWGDGTYLPHSVVIDTLAAVIAFHQLGLPVVNYQNLGEQLSRVLTMCAQSDQEDTVAFEILVPLMLRWINQRLEEPIPLADDVNGFLFQLELAGMRKLNMVRQHKLLFQPNSTLVFASEVAFLLGDLSEEEISQLDKLVTNELGSDSLSIAATAGLIAKLNELNIVVPKGYWQYLNTTYQDYNLEGFPNLHPIANTVRYWILLPWFLSPQYHQLVRHPGMRDVMVAMHQAQPTPETGVSWDPHNSTLPDLDDTALAFMNYNILQAAGEPNLKPMSLNTLGLFRKPDGSFFCYPMERNSAPSHLIHTLRALEITSEVNPILGQTLELQSMQQALVNQIGGHGNDIFELMRDKWQSSPYYTARSWLSSSLLNVHNQAEIQQMVDWILSTQNADGGWGQRGTTIEETAYVVTGLANYLSLHQTMSVQNEQMWRAMQKGREYMQGTLNTPEDQLPREWMSKNAYVPYDIVRGAVIAALNQSQQPE